MSCGFWRAALFSDTTKQRLTCGNFPAVPSSTRPSEEFLRAAALLAIDANARVGSETCGSIGGAGAEKETESGQLFRLMLDRTSMSAVNTHWGAGWTWQSTKRTTSRIDFVCCDAALVDMVQDCRVVDEVDLTMDASVDHRMLMMTMQVAICGKEQKRARREAALDSRMPNDPTARRAFQRNLWRFLKSQRLDDVDKHQLELTRVVGEAAPRRFGSARSAPMKPWILALTWNFLRLVASVRRTFHAAFDVAKMLEERCDFDSAKKVQSWWNEAAGEAERFFRCC